MPSLKIKYWTACVNPRETLANGPAALGTRHEREGRGLVPPVHRPAWRRPLTVARSTRHVPGAQVPYVNHVAVPVDDVDQAVAFYQDWFDARVVPSPRFPVPVAWVLLGKVQLHLVQHPGQPSVAYHFSVAFEHREQFEALYW